MREKTIGQRISQAIDGALATVQRTPVEVSLGVVLMIVAFGAIHDAGVGAGRVFGRFLATAYPLLVCVFGISVLHAFEVISSRARVGLTAALLATGALYGAFVFHPMQQAQWWRWMLLCLAVTMGFGLLPLVIVRQKSVAREMLWNFNARMLLHLSGCMGFLFALFIGLMLGIEAVKELLDVSVTRDAPAYLASAIFLGGAPWMTASVLPRLLSERSLITPESRRLMGYACTYLFAPLMVLYTVILYAYQGKVLLSGWDEAPRNMMSPLVLVAAGLLIVGMMCAEQLHRGVETSRGTFVKMIEVTAALFLPLMPMTIWAVWIRVEQYGWTEFRYVRMLMLVCLVVIFAASIVRWRRRQEQPLSTIIATFGVAALFGAVGPWSAVEVAKSSQIERLRVELADSPLIDERGMLVHGDLLADRAELVISHDAFSQFDYLAEHFGADGFDELIDEYTLVGLEVEAKNRLSGWQVREELGWSDVRIGSREVVDNEYITARHDGPIFIPHSGELYDVGFYRVDDVRQLGDGEFKFDGRGLLWSVEGARPVHVSLVAQLDALVEARPAHGDLKITDVLTSEQTFITLDERTTFILEHVNMHRGDSGEWDVTYLSGKVVRER